jgi:hypothetical protein
MELVQILHRAVAALAVEARGHVAVVLELHVLRQRWICAHSTGFFSSQCCFRIRMPSSSSKSGENWAWHPMQSSTDGTPAAPERSVPEWQY